MTISACRMCGVNIRWVQANKSTKMAPPIEINGHDTFTIVNNILTPITTYELHECDPIKVEEWRVKMEQKRLESEDWRRLRDENYAAAKTQDCPTCDAKIGEQCVNLTVLKWKNIRQAVVMAHQERVEL